MSKMGIFKRLFNKTKKDIGMSSIDSNKSFPEIENRLIPEIKSMIEIAFEYAGFNDQEIDKIYIFNSTEESIFFHFFYRINGQIVKKHKINDCLNTNCDTSPERQSSALNIGMDNLKTIIELFKEKKLEVPKRIKIEYSIKTNKMSSNYYYDNKLLDTDLMEEDLMKEWMKNLDR